MVLARNNVQRRTMALGGHHGPPPEWTGVDKVVRSYVPHDYQCTLNASSRWRSRRSNSWLLAFNGANAALSCLATTYLWAIVALQCKLFF
jgi:hypothetical protein